MTVFSISETRRDRKNPASDSKSAPQISQKQLKNPQIHAINFFLLFSVIGSLKMKNRLLHNKQPC